MSLLSQVLRICDEKPKNDRLTLISRLLNSNKDEVFDPDERVDGGYPLLLYLINDEYVEVIEYILENSKCLDLNAKVFSICGILEHAILWDKYECAKLFLKHNTNNIDVKNCYGYTLLHDVAEKNNKRMVELLLSYNADTSIKSKSDRLASDLAIGEIKRLILEHQDLPSYSV